MFSSGCYLYLFGCDFEINENILYAHKLFDFGEKPMSQAKTLTPQEIKQVLGIIALDKHAERNRAMFLLTTLGGLRVSEVAKLRYVDVVDEHSVVRNEIRLLATQTKGGHERTVFVNERLQKELAHYAKTLTRINPTEPFFYTQKRKGFTPNTLTQHFFWLYKKAGIHGASSHSGRRTFITTLASKGVGVRVLASLAGHANISTTQIYIDVNDDMKRQAVALI
jgi:integrase/recombinase XerD